MRSSSDRPKKGCPEGTEPYAVYRAGKTGWVLRCAESPEAAMKMVKDATAASLMRPSSYWQEQRRLGLYPVKGTKTRRGPTKG